MFACCVPMALKLSKTPRAKNVFWTGLSSQYSSSHILITGGITGAVLQSSLIFTNHSFFSGTVDLQPVSENCTSDPSECRQVANNFILLLSETAKAEV